MAGQTFFRRGLVSCLLLFALCNCPLLLSQMPTLPHDSELLDKIRHRKFREISDTNAGRMDLYAVLWALEKSDCKVPEYKTKSTIKVIDFAVKYTRYLTTDSETGQYPSKEFFTLGAIGMLGGGDAGALLTTNPNTLATAAFIDTYHCGSPKVDELVTNLFAVMDDHIEWHEKNLGSQAEQSSPQRIISIAQSGLAADGIFSPATKEAVRQQIQRASQAQLLECTYGPTHPDSTGSEHFRFWYKAVGISTEEALRVSAKNPLASFGDTPQVACPKKLSEASQALETSLRLARSKIDPSKLPPAEMPLDRVLSRDGFANYNAARRNIDSYQSSHDQKQLDQAVSLKAALLSQYLRQCAALAKTPDNMFCSVRKQLDEDLKDIPDSEDLQALRENPTAPQSPYGGATQANAEYLLAVVTIDPIDLEGISGGREFHAQLERPVNAGPRILLPAGADVYLKGSPFEPGRAMAPGMTHIQIVAAYAMNAGKRIDLTCKPVLKTFRTEKVRVDRNGRTYPYPPRDYSVVPGTRFSLWAQIATTHK